MCGVQTENEILNSITDIVSLDPDRKSADAKDTTLQICMEKVCNFKQRKEIIFSKCYKIMTVTKPKTLSYIAK